MRNLKKIIALVAVFAMLVSTVAFAGTFSDVADTDNYAKAIELLNDLGIVTGDDEDGDGVMDFRPEDTITRAEVTAIIARIQGMDVAAQTATEFEDVPSSHWASGYVAQAASQGIVNGYGDGKFGPEDNVTYEQMIKMLMETLGYRPFATDNGGYPTGYVTAATRYGVLDGVVGGGIGVEASRGMVAQMVYNAINTPLMDPVTYGTDKEYGIYDGVNFALQTLLTRDLKMIKLTGIVTANSLSGTIDTTARKTVEVATYDTADNGYYIGTVNNYVNGVVTGWYVPDLTMYQGDVDCDKFLGYAVEVYAKKMSNFENNYTVVAMEKQAVNSEIAFNLDQYTDYTAATGVVEYLKDVNSNVELSKTIQAGATIIYNGIPVATDDTNNVTTDDSRNVLANYFGGTITANNTLSGKVTLLDTDNNPAYDIVNIEIAVTAVVKEVTNKGQVKFFIAPREVHTGNGVKLVFDDADINTIINLTKNGEAIDYTELKKWDVVSIIWNGSNTNQVYNVTVLDEGNYVDGAVSVAKNNGDVVLTDGNTYEIAANAYNVGTVEPGLAGRFYIDAYGKIVALDDAVEIEGVNTKVDQYAYVLAAEAKNATWGNDKVVYVKLLDMSGEIYEAKLAEKVKLVNFDQTLTATVAAAYQADKNFTAELNDTAFIPDLDAFAAGLVNRLIAYEGNNAGDVKTIVVEAAANSERDLALINSGSSAYNADALTFKNGIAVNEDTKVFYIAPKTAAVSYGSNANDASSTNSAVATIASLLDDQTYTVYGFAPDANDEAQVVVLMNETGRLSAATNIAVIDSVGVSVVNGTDEVCTVSYYMNGELQTATTKVDMGTVGVISAAERGDIVQMTVENGVITYAKAILTFTGLADGTAYAKNAAATPVFALGTPGNTDESYLFGAVTKFSNNGTALVQGLDTLGNAVGAIQYVKEADANVYVYDVNMKADFRLEVGSLGDAEVDEELMDTTKTVTLEDGTTTVTTPAYGMMDYVFVRTYNNKPADIVVYRNYDFGRYNVQ